MTDRSPLDECLSLWADWMRSRSVFHGQPKLLQIFGGSPADFEQDCHEMDISAARAVQAMIDSLTTQHQWAIYYRCGLKSVWNYERLNLELTLADAEQALEPKLRKNNALTHFFCG